jgi:excisionase family DNA binding protein
MVAQVLEERELITATEEQQPALEDFFRVLEGEIQPAGRTRLVGPNDECVELPQPVYEVLRRVIPYLLRGDSVAIVAYHKELTTQQAADLLNVSRQYLVQLCDEGKIPFTKTGTHRRIRYGDLLEYKRQRDTQRRRGLRRLTQMSEELGLYDTARPDAAKATG